MGRDCSKASGNVYFEARKAAAEYDDRLYSREKAAELLGVSVSTLADYENGNTKFVPVDKVVLMADLYHQPELKTGYCKHECPIGACMPFCTKTSSIAMPAPKNNQLATVASIKGMLARDDIKTRFNDILGKKSSQFMASLVNVVAASPQLKASEPNSIMAAAFVAASFDLPIDSNLGFSAIVPFNKKTCINGQWVKQSLAQFQMMYKGYIQLAIRSGEYEKMNCAEVYADELVSYNPITGECRFVDDFSACKFRNEGKTDKIIGYYAWFRLRSGFTKELYMSKAEINNHAQKYSQSYRYDINDGKQSSRWSTDFDAMAKKTVIKLLLSKWGILSVEMQKAIEDDQKVYEVDSTEQYSDNQPDVAEAENPFTPPAIEAPKNEIQPVPEVETLEELDIMEE